MSITCVCVCGKKITVGDHFAGRQGRCKLCRRKILIPVPAKVAPPTAPSAPAGISTLAVACHFCGRSFRVASTLAGKKARCPGCMNMIDVPKSQSASVDPMSDIIDASTWVPLSPKSAPSDPQPRETECPYCGETILSVAKKCKHCNEFLDDDLRKKNAATPAQMPQIFVQANNTHETSARPFTPFVVNPPGAMNPSSGFNASAALLSFFIPGLGQMCRGDVFGGILWLMCTIIGYFFFIIPGLIIHIVCIVHAAKSE